MKKDALFISMIIKYFMKEEKKTKYFFQLKKDTAFDYMLYRCLCIKCIQFRMW